MNSCYLTLHLLHSCMSDVWYVFIRYICIFVLFVCSSVLESQSVENLKIAGVSRFASKVGHLWYFMGLSCKIECFRGNAAGPAWKTTHETARCMREGRCSRYGSALFFSHTFVLGTNASLFWNIFCLPSSDSFSTVVLNWGSSSKFSNSSIFSITFW